MFISRDRKVVIHSKSRFQSHKPPAVSAVLHLAQYQCAHIIHIAGHVHMQSIQPGQYLLLPSSWPLCAWPPPRSAAKGPCLPLMALPSCGILFRIVRSQDWWLHHALAQTHKLSIVLQMQWLYSRSPACDRSCQNPGQVSDPCAQQSLADLDKAPNQMLSLSPCKILLLL